jgi:hypothetical protein
VRPLEGERANGFDEIDLQRAAKILLELYASMNKPSITREIEGPTPVTVRVRQA